MFLQSVSLNINGNLLGMKVLRYSSKLYSQIHQSLRQQFVDEISRILIFYFYTRQMILYFPVAQSCQISTHDVFVLSPVGNCERQNISSKR